ncbi:MAG: DNA alkylation repair protein [Bacteroidota bacterium]|nr:DNA alkylation repair protein [Bacteroidota bacterium]
MNKSNLEDLSIRFKKHEDPERAFQMKKYMKDRYPFFGIQANPRRAICSQFLKDYGFPDKKVLFEMVKLLWEKDEREFQYFGAELANKFKNNIEENDLEIFQWMIVNKSWWDTVDFIAANLVGSYFKLYDQHIGQIMKEWLDSGNIWLQRTTLIFQLKYREKTDVELLTRQILALKDSKEFFIRKAIGWALREYSKTNPDWVREFVGKTAMSGLSTREALKRIKE